LLHLAPLVEQTPLDGAGQSVSIRHESYVELQAL
jgi:hypothetical protein